MQSDPRGEWNRNDHQHAEGGEDAEEVERSREKQ